jgi:excinuclease ABC subunit C
MARTSDSPEKSTPLIGAALIADHVKRLSTKPGVYRMLNGEGEVLYVGKARNLKARVSNYARGIGHNNRIATMIAETRAMEFVTTATETEALLLESNLIKQLKPRYNILLRDDKSFPYILIRENHDSPHLTKHRGARRAKGSYYGPFASAGAVNRTINTLQKAFLLRTCSDSVFENRSRPCMLYQIKRCAGPCVGLVGEAEYGELVEDAKSFLEGRSDALREQLQKDMMAAAEKLEFEHAARLRNRIRALAPITTSQGINPAGIEEADVIALTTQGGQSCVQVFFFRAGQNWGNHAVFPRHDKDAEPGEIMAAFIGQFYDDKPPAKLVLTSHEPADCPLIAEALSFKAERKVTLLTPQRGEKKSIMEGALRNASEALSRRMAESASQARLLDGVMEAFGLDERPNRIEIYDNSHISGTNQVGAMVVAGPEGFEKRAYRTFNIKSEDLPPGDDYGMMREVLRRRFARMRKADNGEDAGKGWDKPDLVLVDGGKGQLSASLETMEELGLSPVDVPLVAISKGPDRDAGREQFHMPGRDSFMLPLRDPVLYYLQRLRDEAHRFAIGTHRAKRSKAIAANPLDEIPGIGPSRKKALLAHFGSARSVKRAALQDLENVPGVSKSVAAKVYDWFQSTK